MSKKEYRICDRCGVTLDGSYDEIEGVIRKHPETILGTFTWPFRNIKFDLCNVCFARFKEWMGEAKP